MTPWFGRRLCPAQTRHSIHEPLQFLYARIDSGDYQKSTIAIKLDEVWKRIYQFVTLNEINEKRWRRRKHIIPSSFHIKQETELRWSIGLCHEYAIGIELQCFHGTIGAEAGAGSILARNKYLYVLYFVVPGLTVCVCEFCNKLADSTDFVLSITFIWLRFFSSFRCSLSRWQLFG